MRKSTTDRMNDYDPVVMGVLEPILVLSVMAVSAFLTRILSSPNFEHVHAASVLFCTARRRRFQLENCNKNGNCHSANLSDEPKSPSSSRSAP
jgi:hypothetical protein